MKGLAFDLGTPYGRMLATSIAGIAIQGEVAIAVEALNWKTRVNYSISNPNTVVLACVSFRLAPQMSVPEPFIPACPGQPLPSWGSGSRPAKIYGNDLENGWLT